MAKKKQVKPKKIPICPSRTENDLSYLKAYYDIFMAAHVFYRNMAKGEQF